MSLSLNEIEATARKAARGAGLSWGEAEEAGRATRWLCAHGLDGCGDLAVLLRGPRHAGPDISPGQWSASRPLCALRTGIALSDFAHLLPGGPIRLTPVAHPRLLLPFASAAARALCKTITLHSAGFIATTDGTQTALTGQPQSKAAVTLTLGGTVTRPLPCARRATPAPTDWARLLSFAARTYAPATEASRLAGAGAGLSDND
ncbi:DUF3726 domain-containing protein [Alterinioella nitratireducens]|uniref:DUF3726 domain-containing protein n=1 Tax=Alterinioella nitratireducens TaxID=2735915 RepID=UPI0040598E23